MQSESDAERLGKCLGSNASTFHSYCIPTPFPRSYPCPYVYMVSIHLSLACGRSLHTFRSPVRSPIFRARVCVWVWAPPCVRGSWITSDVGRAIVCISLSLPLGSTHTHTPTHSHAQTHLQSSRTHTIRLLWRSVSHYGLLGLLHYAACLHSHLLIRSTYTHGCGGVSSKSVNIAASWLPVWPTERTRKKTTTPEWQQHQHIHSPTNRTRPT